MCAAAMDDYIIYDEIGKGARSVVFKGRKSVRAYPIHPAPLLYSFTHHPGALATPWADPTTLPSCTGDQRGLVPAASAATGIYSGII